MAVEETTPKKKYIMSGSVTKELYDRAEDLRWQKRMKMSELVQAAVAAYLDAEEGGEETAPAKDAPAKDAPAKK